MRFYMYCSAIWVGLSGLNGLVCAEELDVGLVSVKPHPSIERKHACVMVKLDEAVAADCYEPKCSSGGAAVEAALASKGLKRICKAKDTSVNRGFDVTYVVSGEKHVAWTARDPEPDLKRIGLMAFEEHSPLNPVCARMSFKEASAISECTQIKK